MEEVKIEESIEKEMKSFKTKWIFLTILIAIFTAVLASDFTLYYYGMTSLNKEESAQNESNDNK